MSIHSYEKDVSNNSLFFYNIIFDQGLIGIFWKFILRNFEDLWYNNLVRISYKTIWLETLYWYENSLKNENWKGLNRYFSKDTHQKSNEGSVRSDLTKNSTPSPWKCRKTTLSAIFRATGARGLTEQCLFILTSL